MLNKAPDPDENRRPRQSMSEWGPGGVSVIQGGGRLRPGGGGEEEGRKSDGTLRRRIKKAWKIRIKQTCLPPGEQGTPPTCSELDRFNGGGVHLRFKRAHIIITPPLSTPAIFNVIQVAAGRHLAPCTRHPLLRAPGMQT